MFVISIVLFFPQRRKILRLYKSFPLVNHKHKKSVKLFVQVEVLVKP